MICYSDDAVGQNVNCPNGPEAIEWRADFMGSSRWTISSYRWTYKNANETTKVSELIEREKPQFTHNILLLTEHG